MRLRRIVICFVVACGARTAPGTNTPGPQECPASAPSIDDVCSVGAPPFSCTYDGKQCDDGSVEQRLYTCWAQRNNFKTWFGGDANSCACPRAMPSPGDACVRDALVGYCMYLVDDCGAACICTVDGHWDCSSRCDTACPVPEPAPYFLPCPKSGVRCFYPHSDCNTIVACVAPLGAPEGSPGVWATIESPDPCDDI
jgi:hypothetical protein